jgi:hypothetical protein
MFGTTNFDRSQHMRWAQLRAVVVSVMLFAVGGVAAAQDAQQPARFLYAWTGDADTTDSDFLAIIDVREGSPTYAQVLKTIPVGATRLNPHHTELSLSGTEFFANGFAHRTLIWSLADPLAPRVTGEVEHAHGFHHAHSFLRLAGGDVLATHQYGDSTLPGNPGGLVRFDSRGRVLQAASSADPMFPGARIRTYALDASEERDLVLTVSSPMDDERTADVFQVWRLSDLHLLSTVQLPPEPDSVEAYPFEPRFIGDGRSALMSTWYCGLYLLRGLDTTRPAAQLVYRFATERGNRACGVPLLVGNYWLMPVAYGSAVVVLDVSDPEKPREVSRLQTDSTVNPHWLSADPGSDRIVLVDQGDGESRIFLLRFDRATGSLRYDESFRDPGSSRVGIDFARESWPHGNSGRAIPHGTFFVP